MTAVRHSLEAIASIGSEIKDLEADRKILADGLTGALVTVGRGRMVPTLCKVLWASHDGSRLYIENAEQDSAYWVGVEHVSEGKLAE